MAGGILAGTPEEIGLGEMEGLNARGIALIAAPGGGKTEACAALCAAPDVGVLAIDPTRQLGWRIADLPRAEVVEVDTDWPETLPRAVPTLRGWLKEQRKVVLSISRQVDYKDVAGISDLAVPAAAGVPDLLIVGSEAQRIVPQNQAAGYSWEFRKEVDEGRNDRHGRVVETQRIASVDKEVFARCETLLLGKLYDDTDAEAVRRRLRMNIRDPRVLDETISAMMDLAAGEFILREPKNPPGVNR